MSTSQIASECILSINTVKTTIANARKKLDADNTTHAVLIAIAKEELGLDHNGHCFIPDLIA